MRPIPYKFFLYILFFICTGNTFLQAQLTADFIPDKTGGCSPVTIYFKNTTTNASFSASYKWDFGNGNIKTTTDINASIGATYSTEKVYSIILTVTDGNKTDVKSINITVYKKPVIDFSVSSVKGCSPFTTTFTSSSIAGDGNITNYFWDFGDGNTQNGAGLSQGSNIYTYAQKAKVGLTVTNSYGCQATLDKPDFVETLVPVIATFISDKTVLCNEGDAVQFTNTSTGAQTLSSSWDFGDGSTASQLSPSHSYAQKGIYTVELSVTSSNGCKGDTVMTSYINVANFNTDFDIPSPICQYTLATFKNNSLPVPASFTWQVDNYLVSSSYDKSMSYTLYTAGSHKVTLTNNFGSCSQSVSKTIIVNPQPVLRGFLINDTTLCGAPTTVIFKDTCSTAVMWNWDFAYNYGVPRNTAITQSPSYTYISEGYYNIYLLVTDAVGCIASVTKSINIQRPYVSINVVKSSSPSNYGLEGCNSLTVTLKANSVSPVTDYLWDFGDGTTSTEIQPQHIYNTPGTYSLKLTYTTTAGCKGVTANSTVSVYKIPVAAFSVSATTVCGNTPVIFTNSSTGTSWIGWYLGNNYSSAGQSYPNYNSFSYQFTDTGTYSIKLIAYNYLCSDTSVQLNYIHVLPPFPKISAVSNTCDGTRGSVILNQASRYATQWQWDYGDGSTPNILNSDLPQVSHTYTKTGMYKVALTVVNGQCTVRDSMSAFVLLKQNPHLSASLTTICASDPFVIQVGNLEENPQSEYYRHINMYTNSYYFSNSILQYGDLSFFKGTNYSNQSYYDTTYSGTLNGLQPGKESIRAIIPSTLFGCMDTTNFISLKINGPIVGFTLQDKVCYKRPVVFTDTSKTITNGAAIKTWEWTFGDNTTQTLTSTGSTTHSYASPNFYYVSLKITDTAGCSASTPNYIAQSSFVNVYGPKADFSWSPANISPGVPVYFINNTNISGSISPAFLWSFTSDGYSTTNYSPLPRTYQNYTIDTVKLVVTDLLTHCSDTLIKPLPVKNIFASFTFTTQYVNNNSCPPLVVYLQNTSRNVTSVKWSFGDGGYAGNNFTPSHTYNKPGVYKVILYGYGTNGLSDSSLSYVTVKGPYATISSNILQSCTPATITLSALASNTVSYTWDFGDGTLINSTDTFAKHTYTQPGWYSPALIMSDGGGCNATFELPDKIVMDSLYVAIHDNIHEICDSGWVQFNPQIFSVAVTRLQQNLQYHWDFGTALQKDTSSIQTPGFFYPVIGKYPVKITVRSLPGCMVEAFDTILVKSSSKGIITGPQEVCEQNPTLFTAQPTVAGNIIWNWNFRNGNTSNQQNPAAQLFTGSTVPYQVSLVTSYNGCLDTTYSSLVVHSKPQVGLGPYDTKMCLGDSIHLIANAGLTYLWSPAKYIKDITIKNPYIYPDQSTTYGVKVTNNFGCTNSDSAFIRVFMPFNMSVSKDTFACTGSMVQLRASGADTYKWTSFTSNINNPLIANPIVLPTKSTSYTVIGKDAAGCFADTAIVTVDVKSLPTINAGNDFVVPVGSVVPLTVTGSSDVIIWNWSPTNYLSCSNCQFPVSTPRSDIAYIVTGKTQFGCFAKDTVSITLRCVNNTVFLPSAFTPNNDKKNDVFYPIGKGIKSVKHFMIFDRSGEKIFERANFNIGNPAFGWDGNYKSYQMQMGTYVYMIELECDTNELFTLKGTVVLIR